MPNLTPCELPKEAKPIEGTAEPIPGTGECWQRFETPDGTAYEVKRKGNQPHHVTACYRIETTG
jgi:hypothetical protein